jgi:hypothetical protein
VESPDVDVDIQKVRDFQEKVALSVYPRDLMKVLMFAFSPALTLAHGLAFTAKYPRNVSIQVFQGEGTAERAPERFNEQSIDDFFLALTR